MRKVDGIDEQCVKERGKRRYVWRAGVMSRNEGEKEVELLARTILLHLKAYSLSRVTVVREGMSVGDDRDIRNALQNDGTRIAEYVIVFSISSE